VRGGRHETLEGDWQPHRMAMLRFPSFEQAKAFYDDEPLPRGARQARLGATSTSTWCWSRAWKPRAFGMNLSAPPFTGRERTFENEKKP
jgi:hypothetical protein